MKLIENATLEASLRIIEISGEPWFVAKDICKPLGIRQTGRALEKLDTDEKGVNLIHTLGGVQKMAIVSESGLYALILRSDKPAARAFRKWITSEVLPAIRKTGAYNGQDWEQELADLEAAYKKAQSDFKAAETALSDYREGISAKLYRLDVENRKRSYPAKSLFLRLDDDTHEPVAWEVLAEHMPLPCRVRDAVAWMAEFDSIPPVNARSRVYRLIKKGLIRRCPDRLLRPMTPKISTTDNNNIKTA